MASNSVQIQISEPKLYTTGAIFIASAYGLIGIIPVFVLFLVVSLLGFKLSTLVISLAVLAFIIWLLPLVSGNPFVSGLVRSLDPRAADNSSGFIVQLTLSPRLRSD